MEDASEKREFRWHAAITSAPGGSDAKWAKWLQRRLENYRIPAELVKTLREPEGGGEGQDGSGLPERFAVARSGSSEKGPEASDGSGGAAGAGGGAEGGGSGRSVADSARFLIIVCSPRGAESPGVERDAAAFAAAGRTGSVIPFIIEGEPSGEGPRNCYPPSAPPDILGITPGDADKDAALIRVIARLLRVKFSRLYQRHLRERRSALRRLLAAASAALAVMLALTLAAVFKQREAAERRAEAASLLEFLEEKILSSPQLPAEARRMAGMWPAEGLGGAGAADGAGGEETPQ